MSSIMMKKCKKVDPPHPCDPPAPCDICDAGAICPKLALCKEKIKNPQKNHETRCKPGGFLPVSVCKKPDPPHPCDPPPPCVPGKSIKPCTDPTLCKEKVKNLEDPYIICHPDPEDKFSRELCENLDMLKTPIKECPKEPCARVEMMDPFDVEDIVKTVEEPPSVVDPNEYLYSRELCANLDLLRQKIVNCFNPPCTSAPMIDPFDRGLEPIEEVEDDPCDPRKKKNKK